MEYLCNTNVVIDKNVVLNIENIYVMTNLKRNGIHRLLCGIFHIMSYQPETSILAQCPKTNMGRVLIWHVI